MPEAYERLLSEAIEGDPSLFTRSDGIETAWSIIDPLIQSWEDQTTDDLAVYDPGSWGPEEADELLNRDGNFWRMNCALHEESIKPSIPQD